MGYGSTLNIGIGEKVYYKNPKLVGKYHGEWDLYSGTYSWKIIHDNKILCGKEDEPDFINLMVKTLNLGSISSVGKRNDVDITLNFSSGIDIEFFCCTTDDNPLSIMKEGYKAYEFNIDGICKVDTNKHFDKLTEIESILSELSEGCEKRWSEQVPKCCNDETCNDCFYFRGIYGHFYFWDYGICSNSESTNDGKLVGVKSGCQFHKHLKDMI